MASRAGFPTRRPMIRRPSASSVSCPQCGSVKVEKAIMAPQIARKKGRDRAPEPVRRDASRPRAGGLGNAAPAPEPISTPLLMAQERELRAKLKAAARPHHQPPRTMSAPAFRTKRRKMHYGEIEAPADLRRGLHRGSPRADRGRHRSGTAAGAAGRPQLGRAAESRRQSRYPVRHSGMRAIARRPGIPRCESRGFRVRPPLSRRAPRNDG